MKNLLIKIWQGEVNLKSARRATTIISILVPIVGIGSFFYRVFNVWDKDNFLYGTVYYDSFFTINLAVGSFILFLSLIVLGRSARKQAHLIKFPSIYITFHAFLLIPYVFICIIMAMVFNFQTKPHDPYGGDKTEGIKKQYNPRGKSPGAVYKRVTRQDIPKGAHIVFHSPIENRRPVTIVLDASEMDLTKWINETKFYSYKDNDFPVTWRKMKLFANSPYMQDSISILECETRTIEKPEDKYFLKICNAFKNNHEIWHVNQKLGRICCRLNMYAFKKEKIMLAIGTEY
jgi:hypothetical protein